MSTVFPFAFPGVNFKRLSSSIQRHFQSSSLALNELDYPKKVAELGKCECLCTVNPSVLSEERKGRVQQDLHCFVVRWIKACSGQD